MEGEAHLQQHEITIASHEAGAARGGVSQAEMQESLEAASGPAGLEMIGEFPPRRFPIDPDTDHSEPQREEDQEAKRGQQVAGFHAGAPPSWRAAWSVFFISRAMVIGPTPPGTGVMAADLGATSS